MNAKETILKGRYKYIPSEENFLGKGTFGTIYKGYDLQTQTYIAIKQLNRSEIILDDYMARALERELEVLNICSSPYSTKLIDRFDKGNYIFIILELCDGDLEKVLKKNNKPFSLQQVHQILYQLNQVFIIMNKNKIMHRDLKLANIFIKYTNPPLNTEFDVKLSDYGFSTIASQGYASTQLGTPMTMAPEVLMGQAYTNKADIWSLGIIVYQMLYGVFPFIARSPPQLLKVIMSSRPKNKPEDKDLANLLDRMLTVNIQARISWEEYFTHPFFSKKSVVNTSNISTHSNDNKEFTINIKGKKICLDINGAKKEIIIPNNYRILYAKEINNGNTYILKQFSKAFIKQNKNDYEYEKQLFLIINKGNISSLHLLSETSDSNTVTLIFENINGSLLSEYIKKHKLSNKQVYSLISSMIKDIFIPLTKSNIALSIITLESIYINFDTGTAVLFDCGLIRKLYSHNQINEYFIYENEIDAEPNEKTNVLNFGVLVFKAVYKMNPIISNNIKEINLPSNTEFNDTFKEMLSLALYRKKTKRADWKTLENCNYLSQAYININNNINNYKNGNNTTLFSIEMLDHIINSYNKKLEAVKGFIGSNINKALPKLLIQHTTLFIYSILIDLTYAIEMFNDFNQQKPQMNSILNILHFPKKQMKPSIHSLNFNIIPPNLRICDNNILSKLSSIPLILSQLKDEFYSLFIAESNKTKKNFSRMQIEELLNESLLQLNDGSMWIYINSLYFSIQKDHSLMKCCGLYIKYLLEYVIMLHGLNMGNGKESNNDYSEINELFVTEKEENVIRISIVENGKEVEEIIESKTFVCFLMPGFKKWRESMWEGNFDLGIIKENNDVFMKYYVNYIDFLAGFNRRYGVG